MLADLAGAQVIDHDLVYRRITASDMAVARTVDGDQLRAHLFLDHTATGVGGLRIARRIDLQRAGGQTATVERNGLCLLYTSDAADE